MIKNSYNCVVEINKHFNFKQEKNNANDCDDNKYDEMALK